MTVIELFERRVKSTPHKIALVQNDVSYTYGQLSEECSQVASTLRNAGAGPEVVVGVAQSRSPALIISLLATLKAEAVLLSLDKTQPKQRLDDVLREAAPVCVLVDDHQHIETAQPVQMLSRSDCLASRMSLDVCDHQGTKRQQRPSGLNAAYVTYTSGSTGKPKGVVGLQQGLVNRIGWFRQNCNLTPNSRVLAKTAMSFIDGVTEVLTPLACGATIVLADDREARSLRELARLTRQYRVTHVTVVPSLLDALLEEWSTDELGVCRHWISSGEPLRTPVVAKFARRCPQGILVDLYGVSEASGDSMSLLRSGGETRWRTLTKTEVHILDRSLEPVPVGVRGELCISGVGLARGYLSDAGMTAERFVANPYGPPGSRLYRTGDIVVAGSDGSLEFVGRVDQELSLAGVRIDGLAIETEVKALNGIRDAVVIGRAVGDRFMIVAYVVGLPLENGQHEPAEKSIRRLLNERLPTHMIPSAFVTLDRLPRLPNGKVDRLNLPDPLMVVGDGQGTAKTPEEEVLCGVFTEILEAHGVTPASDFFALGGHSLQAMRIANRIQHLFGVRLTVEDVFERPRIADLAAHVVNARTLQVAFD